MGAKLAQKNSNHEMGKMSDHRENFMCKVNFDLCLHHELIQPLEVAQRRTKASVCSFSAQIFLFCFLCLGEHST